MNEQSYMYVTIIAATPEEVWKGLTTAEFTCQYWHSTRVHSTWEEGSVIVFLVDGKESDEVGCEGHILAVDFPRKLSYSWCFPRDESTNTEQPSRVTFLLEPVSNGTKLTVIHDHLDGTGNMHTKVSLGWPCVLSGLKTLLETGMAVDFSRDM